MQTLKFLCVAFVLATTCGSNKFTDLSENTMEPLRQPSSEQLQEFIDEEEGTLMLQNSTQDYCDCGPKGKGCKYVEGRRECICNYGYADYEGVCQRCKCEIPNQICSFRWLNRYCTCPDGYEERYQRCEIVGINTAVAKMAIRRDLEDATYAFVERTQQIASLMKREIKNAGVSMDIPK
ncbi:uncharacterized protein LOC118199065 [Stegodyphus dumicola]|uniref:uncharacterized protein LOC118199065 n=1 Tax=Stegodyphus dumicola TaxID=202533 RepID=UPI0015AF03A5|nr:uncharacterized protein LOC118199065 [Stegodyphus dumicola]